MFGLQPRGITTGRASVGGGHGGGGHSGHGGGHGGGFGKRGTVVLPYGFGGIWDGYDSGYGYDQGDQVINLYLNGATVGDLGTYDSALPVLPQARAAAVNSMWVQLNPAVVDCVSKGKITSNQSANFQTDYEGWESFYNKQSTPIGMPPPLPGMTFPPGSTLGVGDLSTIDAWWGKALGWRNVVAGACGTHNLPVVAPQDKGSIHDSIHDLAAALESVVVIGALGLGVWFLWPILIGARKVGI